MSYCTQDTCRNGNCPGCRNGQLWCDDPRCAPYCQSCEMPDDFDYLVNVLFIVIIIGLVILILAVLFLYGPRFRYSPTTESGSIVKLGQVQTTSFSQPVYSSATNQSLYYSIQ